MPWNTPVIAEGRPRRDCASSPPRYSSDMIRPPRMAPMGCRRPMKATMMAAKPQPGDTDGSSWPIGPAISKAPARPAKAPEISSDTHSAERAEKPAQRAACGATPPTISEKPRRLRIMKTAISTAATMATAKPMCRRVPEISMGSMNSSENTLDCGKFMPLGSFSGPFTAHISSSCATQVSISETRISLALNWSRRQAVMAAHSAPPMTPATIISTRPMPPEMLWPGTSSQTSIAPEHSAPTVNWPSAPMFQMLARKHTARPSAHRISGIDFNSSSLMARLPLKGSTRNTFSPASGSLPSARNSSAPSSSVATMAITGDRQVIVFDGAPRNSRRSGKPMRSAMAHLRTGGRGVIPQAAHPHAHLLAGGLFDRDGGREPSLGDHMQAITQGEQFVKFFRDHQHGTTFLFQFQDFTVDLRRSAHVHAPGRLGHHEHRRLAFHLAADDELLQVAAREALGRRIGTGRLDLEAFDDGRGRPTGKAEVDHAVLHIGRLLVRQQHIGRQRQGRYGTASQAFFRHQAQAGRAARIGREIAHRLAGQHDHVGGGTLVLAGERRQQFLLAVAGDAGDTDDLAGTHFALDVLQFGGEQVGLGQRQTIDVQLALVALRIGIALALQAHQFVADHHAREAGAAFIARIAIAGHAAAAHDGGAVAQRADLVELVADVEDAAAFVGQATQGHEEFLHRLRGQHRGRFVQDQQLRLGQQGAHDFHALALAHRQRMHMALRFQLQAVLLAGTGDALGQLLQVGLGIQAQGDVLGDGERIEQREMLEHHGNAQLACHLRVGDLHRRAVPAQFAGIGLDRAEDDLHQGGLAGAVFAEHGMDLAGRDRQADVVVGQHARIGLADVADFKAEWNCAHVISLWFFEVLCFESAGPFASPACRPWAGAWYARHHRQIVLCRLPLLHAWHGPRRARPHFPRCAQAVVRRSTMANNSYMAMAMAPITTRPAKASGIFMDDPADTSRQPMPWLEAFISDTVEPTKASVMATFSEAKKYGMERGKPTLSRISMRRAPSTRKTSSSSGSSVARPVAMLTMMGKKEIRKAVRIAGPAPMPNQTTSTGTKAALGKALKAVIRGQAAAYSMGEEPMTKPSVTPTATAMAKPTMVTQKVESACSVMGPANSTIACRIEAGLGKMKSETFHTLQMNCQMPRMMMSRIQGASVVAAWLSLPEKGFFMIGPGPGSSIAHVADVLAQLVYQGVEGVGVSGFELAGARQRIVALDHDAARALAHHIDGVGQEGRFAQVVRDQDDVEAALGPQVAQHAPQLLAGEGVERTKGLVQQQHLGFVDECAADRGALLHAPRELPGELVGVAIQAHGLEQLQGALGVFGLLFLEVAAIGLDDLQRQQHILQRGAPGQQRGRLEGHADELQRPGHDLAADDHAATIGLLQARGQLHERGLATAGGADDGDEFACPGLQVDVFHRKFGGAIIGQVDVAEIDEGFAHGSGRFSSVLPAGKAMR
eukprot:TRINITY_DN427_c2_g1_i1.p1 TRINITY_DN427_c2_g1~~TRINITY_DN427_c2_g1_i1.p1  ORF type:complete len:1458 (+),score=547.10 TRINITY_DN427_c2_g1_i1:21634-26007(+)